MNEDTTRDLPARSFEERVLAEFAALRQEVSAMNKKTDHIEQEIAVVKQDVHGMKLVINEMNHQLHDVNNRLTTLEEKVEARSHETRPMWEAVLVQVREVKDGIALLNAKITELIRDSMAIRARVVLLEEREQTPVG